MFGSKVSAIGLTPKRLTLKIESRLNQQAPIDEKQAAIVSDIRPVTRLLSWTAPHLDQKLCYLRGNANVSGKALAAGFTRHSPAASALPLTKVALSN